MTLNVSSGMAVPSGISAILHSPSTWVRVAGMFSLLPAGRLGGDAVGVHGVGHVKFIVEDVLDAGAHHPRGPENQNPLVRFPGDGGRLGEVLAGDGVVVLVAAAGQVEVLDHGLGSGARTGSGREEHGGVVGLPALSSVLLPTGPERGIWAQDVSSNRTTASSAAHAAVSLLEEALHDSPVLSFRHCRGRRAAAPHPERRPCPRGRATGPAAPWCAAVRNRAVRRRPVPAGAVIW